MSGALQGPICLLLFAVCLVLGLFSEDPSSSLPRFLGAGHHLRRTQGTFALQGGCGTPGLRPSVWDRADKRRTRRRRTGGPPWFLPVF